MNVTVAMVFRVVAGEILVVCGIKPLTLLLSGSLGTAAGRVVLGQITQVSPLVLIAATAPGMSYTAVGALILYPVMKRALFHVHSNLEVEVSQRGRVFVMQRYSIKMRASAKVNGEDVHISGAEKIVPKEDLEVCCSQLLRWALQHSKGKPNFINLKTETIDESELLLLPALPVTTIEMGTVLEEQTVVQQYGTGSGDSHLLTGTTTLHVQLEEALARFKGREF